MKLLIVAPAFPPDRRVGAVRMGSLARYLLKKDVSITVITNRKDNVEIPVSKYIYVDTQETGRYSEKFAHNEHLYLKAFNDEVDSEQYDTVIVSGGPFYTFSIAKASKYKKIPCVLDFRDPWIFDYREAKEFFSPKKLYTKIRELPKERAAVKEASAVVTVTDGWKQDFEQYYPSQRGKFYTISNGYDDELLTDLHKADYNNQGKIVIGVFGKLFYYTEQYSKVFLNGVRKFADKVSVLQIGEREPEASGLLEACNISSDLIKNTGFLPYKEGMEYLMNADVLMIIDVRANAIGTKIYDYIFLGKPIVFVGPRKTQFADMVGKISENYICSTTEEVEDAFTNILAGHVKKTSTETNIKDYARSSQNERWWKLLNEVYKN